MKRGTGQRQEKQVRLPVSYTHLRTGLAGSVLIGELVLSTVILINSIDSQLHYRRDRKSLRTLEFILLKQHIFFMIHLEACFFKYLTFLKLNERP